MIKIAILGLIMVGVMSGEVPCTITEESPAATISDCSASRVDEQVL